MLPSENVADDALRSQQRHLFQSVDDGIGTEYEKHEASGCTTRLYLRPDWLTFFMSHDIRCKADLEKRENVSEIAGSISEIMAHFDLVDEIRSKSEVHIVTGWLTHHEPLIRFINDDETWPINIYTYLEKRHEKKIDKLHALRDRIRQGIAESEIYDPFAAAMQKIGCDMILKERFYDGLFFNRNNITKDTLIRRGVFSRGEAKKDEYPVLKGGIRFDLKCNAEAERE